MAAKAKSPATVPTDIDPLDFLATIQPDRKREDAGAIDALFRRATGETPRMWGPAIIGYGEYRTIYDSGREVHFLRSGFSPRKANHALYLMGGYSDPDTAARHERSLDKLGKFKRGASCLYINKLADIEMAVLEDMVREDYEAMNRLYPD